MSQKTSANTSYGDCYNYGQVHIEAILAGSAPNNYTVEFQSGYRMLIMYPLYETIDGQSGGYAWFRALRCESAMGNYTIAIVDTVNAGQESIVWTEYNVTFNIEAGVTTVAQMWAAAGGVTGTPWMENVDVGTNGLTVGTNYSGYMANQFVFYQAGIDGSTFGHETITWSSNKVVFNIEGYGINKTWSTLFPVSTSAMAITAAGGVTGTPWATLSIRFIGTLTARSETAMHDLPDYIAGTDPCLNVATQALSNNFTDSAYHFVKLNIIRNSDTTITTKCTVDQGTELVVNDAADFLDTIFTALSIANVANCFSGQPSVTPVQFFDLRVHKAVLADAQLKFYYDNVRASGNKTLTQV